jgi:CheY-like chemotaxis protein
VAREVVIQVEDTGMGISPELLPRVFDLFVQARQTLARSQGGLGLGLTIASSLVGLHGGKVVAESEGLGRGSRFTVSLPALDAGPPVELEGSRRQPEWKSQALRVLVVDDNQDAAEMLSEALQLLGYRTATAHDGPEALRVAGDFQPDTVLLDIGLPVMDGYELAQRLRSQFGRELLLIAITGYGQEADRLRSKAAGCQDHFTKPVDLQRLAERLARMTPRSERVQ